MLKLKHLPSPISFAATRCVVFSFRFYHHFVVAYAHTHTHTAPSAFIHLSWFFPYTQTHTIPKMTTSCKILCEYQCICQSYIRVDMKSHSYKMCCLKSEGRKYNLDASYSFALKIGFHSFLFLCVFAFLSFFSIWNSNEKVSSFFSRIISI